MSTFLCKEKGIPPTACIRYMQNKNNAAVLKEDRIGVDSLPKEYYIKSEDYKNDWILQEIKMLAVKARYKDGVIDLLEPIPAEIKEAELNIVVIPQKTAAPKLKQEADDIFTIEDKKAYEEAMKDYKKGKYIEIEDYMRKRGITYLFLQGRYKRWDLLTAIGDLS
jgi:hypothetical protein